MASKKRPWRLAIFVVTAAIGLADLGFAQQIENVVKEAAAQAKTAVQVDQDQRVAVDLGKYFPATTAIYMEFNRPDQLVEKIATHSIVEYVANIKQVKDLVRSPQFAMALLAKGMIEAKIEEPLLDAIKTSVAQGLVLGVDTETNGVAILMKSKDEAKLRRLLGTLLNVASMAADKEGKKDPFKKQKYRDAVAAEFDGFLIARYESWFVISNKPKLAQKIVDSLIDGPESSLSKQPWFQDAQKQHHDSDAWAAVDLETLRTAGVAKDLFRGKTDNPGAELILGGVLDALKHAPVAVGQLNLNRDLEISFSVPFETKWASKARSFFFGQQMDGVAPTPLLPNDMIANLVSYRDVADWWLSKEDLFEENVIASLAQADSQLSTIFSGMDFGEDVLGSLQPGLQIVVAENSFDEKYVPDVKLPAFALVGKLKDPKKMQRKLKIAFQSVIGFANINLGMNGQPQLDLETESIGESKISAAQYFYDDDVEEGLLLFNFSPTIAFQGSYLIVSSDRELAVELAGVAKDREGSEHLDEPTNTKMNLDIAMLSRILKANRESLVTQNMLEDGKTKQESEETIEVLLSIVDLFKDGNLDFRVKEDEMRLDIRLTVDEANAQPDKAGE